MIEGFTASVPPSPDSFRVNVSIGDPDRAGFVSVDGPAVPLARRAVSESVGDFSFISALGTVDVDGCTGVGALDGEVVVGEAGVTVTAGPRAVDVVMVDGSTEAMAGSKGRGGKVGGESV